MGSRGTFVLRTARNSCLVKLDGEPGTVQNWLFSCWHCCAHRRHNLAIQCSFQLVNFWTHTCLSDCQGTIGHCPGLATPMSTAVLSTLTVLPQCYGTKTRRSSYWRRRVDGGLGHCWRPGLGPCGPGFGYATARQWLWCDAWAVTLLLIRLASCCAPTSVITSLTDLKLKHWWNSCKDMFNGLKSTFMVAGYDAHTLNLIPEGCVLRRRVALDDFVYCSNCVLLSCYKFTLGMHCACELALHFDTAWQQSQHNYAAYTRYYFANVLEVIVMIVMVGMNCSLVELVCTWLSHGTLRFSS